MKKKFGLILVVIGIALLCGAGYLAYDNWRREQSQQEAADRALKGLADAIPKFPENSLPIKTVDGYDDVGILEIPKLGKQLPVLATCDESILDVAPGLYSGNPYFGNLVIGGHNSYPQFWGLNSLAAGDEVRFTDFNDIVWTYTVAGSEVLYPQEVEELIKSDYELSLFNCTWDNSQRLVVRCKSAGK